MRRRERALSEREAGDSLVELLVTMVVLGIATTGVTGALSAVGRGSAMHRQQILAQNVLRSWAEQVSAAPYADCATAGSVAAPAAAMPSGFAASVTGVQYWNGTAFAGSCTADTGVQRITLRVTAPNGLSPAVSQSVAVVVRKPCVTTC